MIVKAMHFLKRKYCQFDEFIIPLLLNDIPLLAGRCVIFHLESAKKAKVAKKAESLKKTKTTPKATKPKPKLTKKVQQPAKLAKGVKVLKKTGGKDAKK